MKTAFLPFNLMLIVFTSLNCDKDDGPTGMGTWSCGNKLLFVNKIYKTVQIGSQCWLRENLDLGAMIYGSDTAKDNGIIEKYCYNDSIENCNTYGGLYQWTEAMRYTTTEGSQGICPTGWHIPTRYEFDTLRTFVNGDGRALKAIGQDSAAGAGTNTSGFSALLAGYQSYKGNSYGLSEDALYWSSTDYNLWDAYCMYLNGIVGIDKDRKTYRLSVRCLKDE